MKNLVVTVIIAIVVMASFSQVNAQVVIVPDPISGGSPAFTITTGDIIEIVDGDVGIDEERKIFVRVEDGNTTDGKGKVHFKIIGSDGQNMRSYNFKDGEGAEINIPGGASIQVIKSDEGLSMELS